MTDMPWHCCSLRTEGTNGTIATACSTATKKVPCQRLVWTAMMCLLISLPCCVSFSLIPIPLLSRVSIPIQPQYFQQQHTQQQQRRRRRRRRLPSNGRCWTTQIHANNNDDDDDAFDDSSNDPFVILGLDVPTADPKVIKRAYKRRALRFHPDVITTTTRDSTPAQKKAASDRFAKINWAYQTLSGQREANDRTYGGGGKSSSSSTTKGTGGWTPPHRRSGAYSGGGGSSDSSSSRPGTTDWRDFMPKYGDDDDRYDAGGDSFGKILNDLFAGAAMGAAGVAGSSAGLLYDFIEFLEGNVDGYGASSGGSGGRSSGSDDYDAELQVLLRTGSLDDVGNEMDDTTLVVEQLQAKATNIDDEILTTNAEAKMASKYMEKIELEERVAELKARKGVIDGYLKKSQKRLLALQTRYKELITGGANDSYAGGGGSRREQRSSSPSEPSYKPSSTSYGSESSSTTTSPSSSYGSPTNTDGGDTDSWKREGFGSSGRGSRGSSRRRARRSATGASRTPSGASSSSYSNTSSAPPPPSRTESTSYSSSRSASSSPYSRESMRPSRSSSSSSNRPSTNTASSVPPHRRTSANYESSVEENKRRMREIKVDEEFEKLKKELGM